MFKFVFNLISDLIWPPVCFSCSIPLPLAQNNNSLEYFLCSDCASKLEFLPSSCCTVCGRPYFNGENLFICSDCQLEKPKATMMRSAVAYNDVLSTTIGELKYHKQLHHIKFLALIAKKYLNLMPLNIYDYVTPIPLSKTKLKKRGFNQSLEIAKKIFHSDKLAHLLLRKPEKSIAQALLSASERKIMIKDAFSLEKNVNVKNKNILIFDDVLTTGATANEAVSVLLNAGAKRVDLYTIARTIKSQWR